MSETENKTKFAEIIKELKDGLGMNLKELAEYVNSHSSTLLNFGRLEFQGVKWEEGRIKLLALYFGEEIDSDIEKFKENIWKTMSLDGDDYKKSKGISELEKKYKDDNLNEFICNVKEKVKKRYNDAKNGNLQKSDEERKVIQEYILRKYPHIQFENKDSGIIPVKSDVQKPAAQINPALTEVEEVELCVKMLVENEGLIKDTEQEPTTENLENGEVTSNSIKDSLNNTIEPEEDLGGSEKDEKSFEVKYNISKGIVLSSGAQTHLEAEKEYQVACSKKDPDEYIQHLQCATELGHREAIYRLGVAYINGEGVIHDPQKAVDYFFMAGKMGSADAVNQLRFCYMKGNGVEKNEMKAVWLLNILRKIQYQPRNSTVDISLDKSTKLKNNYKKELKKFVPETDDDYKIYELVCAWKEKCK